MRSGTHRRVAPGGGGGGRFACLCRASGVGGHREGGGRGAPGRGEG